MVYGFGWRRMLSGNGLELHVAHVAHGIYVRCWLEIFGVMCWIFLEWSMM